MIVRSKQLPLSLVMWLGIWGAIIAGVMLFSSSQASAKAVWPQAAPLPNPDNARVIVVDTTEDPTSDSITNTCTYDQGALFNPATPCSFRRAIVEASAVPEEERPVIIVFDIPDTDPNYDSNLDIWEVQVEDTLPPLKTPSVIEPDGLVYIDGGLNAISGLSGRSDGPRIFINSEYSLEVEREMNVIQNLGWYGGGTILIKEDNNHVENIWMGLSPEGDSLAFEDPSDPADLAGGGIYVIANNTVVSGTVVAGATGRAIDIQGNENLVTQNYIGTRADGTVPAVAPSSQCLRSLSYDPANWYGGWGIQMSGQNNIISRNVIAGLHITQSANDTPPMALEISGSNHTITDNLIGIDAGLNEVGVCGIGALVSGTNISIVRNAFVQTRKGFEEDQSDTAIYISGSTTDQISVRTNLVKDGPSKVINFAGTVSNDWRFFEPAKITMIDGQTITGTSGDGSPCPNCLVDIYFDDQDDIEEALEYAGSVQANANGNFTFELPRELTASEGLRTISTSQSFGIIGSKGSNTSTAMSVLYTVPVPISEVTITGPTSGDIDTNYIFSIEVSPAEATLPITFTVNATGIAPIEEVLTDTTADLTLNWSTPGTKEITVTADNGVNELTSETFTVEITDPDSPAGTAMTGITITGPTSGTVDTSYVFQFEVLPASSTLPITYTVSYSDYADLEATFNDTEAQLTASWATTGTKTIVVTADNGVNSVTSDPFTISISEDGGSSSEHTIYLPAINR